MGGTNLQDQELPDKVVSTRLIRRGLGFSRLEAIVYPLPQCLQQALTVSALPASIDYLKSRVFRSAPKTRIKRIFDQHRRAPLFQLYWLMYEAGYSEETAGWENAHRNFQPIEFDNGDAETTSTGDPVSLCKELHAARRIAAFKGRAILNSRKEAANREEAEAGGTLRDCGCCFSDEPMNRMVSCDVTPEHVSGHSTAALKCI